MRRVLFVLTLVGSLCLGDSAWAAYGPAQHVFDFQGSAIYESSGVAPAAADGVLFTHNDSGDSSRFFAVGSEGQTLATYDVVVSAFDPGYCAPTGPYCPHTVDPFPVDWEDMARGVAPDGPPAVFLGDIGDNYVSNSTTGSYVTVPVRPFVTVYQVAEPNVNVAEEGVTRLAYARPINLVYEDGPHNAETLLFNPSDGKLVIVTKEEDGLCGVYEANLLAAGIGVLQKIAEVNFDAIARPYDPANDFGPASRLLTTGGAISPDGTKVVVRTYVEAFEWTILDGDLAAAFAGTPERIVLPQTDQGEAISYSRDGSALFVTSEGLHAPVHRLDRVA